MLVNPRAWVCVHSSFAAATLVWQLAHANAAITECESEHTQLQRYMRDVCVVALVAMQGCAPFLIYLRIFMTLFQAEAAVREAKSVLDRLKTDREQLHRARNGCERDIVRANRIEIPMDEDDVSMLECVLRTTDVIVSQLRVCYCRKLQSYKPGWSS